MSSFFHVGQEADEQPEPLTPSLLTPAVEARLESLGVSIPVEIPQEEIGTNDNEDATAAVVGINPKDLIGVKKPNLALVPPSSALYQAQAMMDGAAKYGPYNWRENPVLAMVYIAAAQRHIASYLDGEDIDPKSGVPHLGHGLACLGILADATETGNLKDDRPVKGPAADMVRRFEDTQSFAK